MSAERSRADADHGAPDGDDRGTGAGSAWAGVEDPRLREGVAHLQHAARELIAASRALLDVAEELVEHPAAARDVASLLGTVVHAAGRAVGGGLGTSAASGEGPDPGGPRRRPDDDPPVQRIPIS